jgi:hypothetical protein
MRSLKDLDINGRIYEGRLRTLEYKTLKRIFGPKREKITRD